MVERLGRTIELTRDVVTALVRMRLAIRAACFTLIGPGNPLLRIEGDCSANASSPADLIDFIGIAIFRNVPNFRLLRRRFRFATS